MTADADPCVPGYLERLARWLAKEVGDCEPLVELLSPDFKADLERRVGVQIPEGVDPVREGGVGSGEVGLAVGQVAVEQVEGVLGVELEAVVFEGRVAVASVSQEEVLPEAAESWRELIPKYSSLDYGGHGFTKCFLMEPRNVAKRGSYHRTSSQMCCPDAPNGLLTIPAMEGEDPSSFHFAGCGGAMLL